MKNKEIIKQAVKDKYNQIALQAKKAVRNPCCTSECCSTDVSNIMNDDYHELEGYNPDADLGLGCGLPTQFARIKEGDTVIDLGSGAGNDCFVARHEAGESGKVIGVDFSEEMIGKARKNAERLGYNNVEFRYGEIENLLVSDNEADVIVSNCVLNLVPDKEKAFQEIFRILKPGGHFSISDIVLVGELPDSLKHSIEMYAGCVAGAIQKAEYLEIVENAGFKYITIQDEKPVSIPEETLKNYFSEEDIARYKESGIKILSITVYGEKEI